MTLASVQTFFSSINWGEVFATIGSYVPDAIQIAILYFVIYSVLKAARGSRFGQVLMGAGILVTALAAFTFLFQFDVLQKILSGLLIYLALSTVVLFQPEIRRILETVGAVLTEDKKRRGPTAGEIRLPEKLADILFLLAKRRLGALVAIERAMRRPASPSTRRFRPNSWSPSSPRRSRSTTAASSSGAAASPPPTASSPSRTTSSASPPPACATARPWASARRPTPSRSS